MNTKRILQLPAGTTPAEADQFLAVQGTVGTPVTRRLSFSVLLTLFSTLHKGAWSGATTYAAGQIAERNGASYQCILAHVNQVPPNATYWRLIADKGATGAAGSTWRYGTTSPLAETGSDGDYYLRTTNADVYFKASGTWSIIANIKGATGDIREWIVGSGAPTGGENGDWYLDGTTGDIYGPKATGTWPASPVANIQGPQGDPGPAGGSGPTGGTIGQVWFKLSGTDYDGEWRISAIGDVSGLTAALAGKASATHAATHAPGGADAIPWGTVHGRGITAAKPAAAAGNAGYLYFDTTLGKLQRSTGSAWEDVSEAGGGGTPTAHASSHAPGGSDALPWTAIHGRGVTGSRPAAAAGNAGYLYFDTTLGKLQRSTGSTWEDVAEVGGSASNLKQAVRAATTANITLSGAQTIDGVAIVAADRVLVKSQTDATANGIYLAASGAWTRATDATTELLLTGIAVAVTAGTVNIGQVFILTASAVALSWSNITAAGQNRWRTCLANADGTYLVAIGATGGGGSPLVVKSSTDGGATWGVITPAGLPASGTGYVQPNYQENAYLCGSQTLILLAIGGVYTTTNNGGNWTFRAIAGGYENALVVSAACDTAASTIYAATAGTGVSSVQKSTDSGNTWTNATPSGYNANNIGLVRCSTNGSKVILAQAGGNDRGVYRSADSAASWTKILTCNALAACMSEDGTKIAAYSYNDAAIKISTDSGASFTTAYSPTLGVNCYGLRCSNDFTSIIGQTDGNSAMLVTTDSGATWAEESVTVTHGADVARDGSVFVAGGDSANASGYPQRRTGASGGGWLNSNRTQTASRIMATDANGHITTTAAASLAELAFLAGVSSGVQTQLDAKETADTILTVTTTNATPTALTTIALANNTARKFTMEVVGRRTDTGADVAGWDYTGVIKRGANAAATAMQGTAVKDDATGANPAGWDSDALADTSGGGLQPRVTGESGATINWKVRVRTTTV